MLLRRRGFMLFEGDLRTRSSTTAATTAPTTTLLYCYCHSWICLSDSLISFQKSIHCIHDMLRPVTPQIPHMALGSS